MPRVWVWVVRAMVWGAVGLGGASPALAATPVLTPVPGSPFSNGAPGWFTGSVVFSPSGGLLAVGNNAGTEGVFSVSSAGALTPVPGSPFGNPRVEGSRTLSLQSLAFSPSGGLLAVPGPGVVTAGHETSFWVAVFSVNSSTGALTQVPGSPFVTGADPGFVAFSPSGGLLAVGNADGTVSTFSVNSSTGALTQVPGSPFATGFGALAFSPSGRLLAVVNAGIEKVSVFSVNSAGGLAPVPGSPFAAGTNPQLTTSVAFSPSGGLLAVADYIDNSVVVFSVNSSTGALTQVPGSPFASGYFPASVAFSPSGGLLGVAGDGMVSLFSVSSNGALAQVPGSPFAGGGGALAFSPSGGLLAVGDGGSVSVFSISSTLAAEPPIEASNQIIVSHVKAQADGTISFQANVPGPGALDVLETAWNDNLAVAQQAERRQFVLLQPAPGRFVFARSHRSATRAGPLSITTDPTGRGPA